jgi:hypothetical protein
MEADQTRVTANLLASKFIARPDVKAIQRSNGDYNPVDKPFTRADIEAHLRGEVTYGHYLLNPDGQCKLFVFDIDLDKWDKLHPERNEYLRAPTQIDTDGVFTNWMPCDPRDVWLDRSRRIERLYFKYQLRMMASSLASAIASELDIQVACTYTGAKGLHVYGFTGLMPASDVRDGANLVIESLDTFETHRGNNFFKHKWYGEDENSFQCLTLEVFPKQVTLDGKGYGNLCRLPLGRNLKNPKDPTFFLDFRSNFSDNALMPRNAVDALTCASYWS